MRAPQMHVVVVVVVVVVAAAAPQLISQVCKKVTLTHSFSK